MRRRWLATVAVIALLCLTSGRSGAQSSIPRTLEGKPDLSGIWQALTSAHWNVQEHRAQLFPGLPARFAIPAGQGVVEGSVIPYQPWAAAKQQENFLNRDTADPEARCYLPGVPRIMYMPYPFQIVQTPSQVTILFEYVHAVRHVYMNSPHPRGPIEWFLGDSRGHWEGDTLVFDVQHFTNQTWFDRAGNFHSEELHVVERLTLMGRDHIDYEVTVEDPKVFTRPWKMRMPLYRRMDRDIRLFDFECYAFLYEQQEGRK